MSKVEEKIQSLHLELPQAFKFPTANRTGCVQVGNLQQRGAQRTRHERMDRRHPERHRRRS